MEELKPWWMSKTIWTGLATAIFAVLAAAGVLPAFLTFGLVDQLITTVLGVATVYFRAKADKAIAPVVTTPTA